MCHYFIRVEDVALFRANLSHVANRWNSMFTTYKTPFFLSVHH